MAEILPKKLAAGGSGPGCLPVLLYLDKKIEGGTEFFLTVLCSSRYLPPRRTPAAHVKKSKPLDVPRGFYRQGTTWF